MTTRAGTPWASSSVAHECLRSWNRTQGRPGASRSLENVFTQARTEDEIELMARDVIAAMLEVPHDSFELIIERRS